MSFSPILSPRFLFAAFALVSVASGCASDAELPNVDESEEDLTRTPVGVELDQSDNAASFSVEPGKKIVLSLLSGGLAGRGLGKYSIVSGASAILGKPKILSTSAGQPDAPTLQRFEWKVLSTAKPGSVARVTLKADGPLGKTFSFRAKVASAAGGPRVSEGKICGGIAGLRCEAGLDCRGLDNDTPDDTGVCRKRFPGAGIGKFCAGIAAIRCEDGLDCVLGGTFPDASGTCVVN
jgi:hypothetical protein